MGYVGTLAPFKMLDLFAGIGGFSYAGHQLGWETVAFVEWDNYNQKVLNKNFPGVPVFGDIREYKGDQYAADIICGGFPCQPFSTAGRRKGTDDERYLWPEMLRVIREVQPAYVVGENVAGIYSMDDGRVFEQVFLDLENEGYAVQPYRIPACAVGAPHRRDRWWFVAAQDAYIRVNGEPQTGDRINRDACAADEVRVVANANCIGHTGQGWNGGPLYSATYRKGSDHKSLYANQFKEPWHEVATRLCRVDDGLPAWVDRHRASRLKSLGNAIVPQVAYPILKAIDGHRIAHPA